VGRGWIAVFCLPFLIVTPSRSCAQVLHVDAGVSTAERAGGSRVRFWHGRSDGWISAGDAGDRGAFGMGGYVRTRFNGWTLEVGDVEIPLVLDTDLFGAGSGIPLRGIGYNRVTPQTSWALYGGATTREISGPSFRSATIDRPALALRFDARLREDITFASRSAISDHSTSIQSVRWRIDPGLELAAAAGLGGGRPYAATSIIRERDAVSVRAAWIHASDRFRRQVARLPDVAEPDGLNVGLVLRPVSGLNVTAGRHSYLVAEARDAGSGKRYAVHTLGAQTRRGMFLFSVSGHEAAVRGGRTRGAWARAGITPSGPIAGEFSVLASDPAAGENSTSVSVTISERLTQRLALTQVITRASGHTSISMGGELVTNPIRARIEYRTMFVPVASGNAFQQAMIVQTEILPAGNLRLNVGTHIRPDGRVFYRISAGTWLNSSRVTGSVTPVRMPRYLIRGRVIDEEGETVAGAALRIGNELIFTNSNGEFFVRVKNKVQQVIQIDAGEFLTVHRYESVRQPERVTPAEAAHASPVTLVVRRVAGPRTTR